MPNSVRIRDRCGTSTPFGLPVVPEVYGIVKSSHSSTASRAAAAAGTGALPASPRSSAPIAMITGAAMRRSARPAGRRQLRVGKHHPRPGVVADGNDFRQGQPGIDRRQRYAGLGRAQHDLHVLDGILADDRAVLPGLRGRARAAGSRTRSTRARSSR